MEVVFDILGGVVGLAVFGLIAFRFGVAFRRAGSVLYWTSCFVAVVAGVALATYGFSYSLSWLWIGAFAAIAGSLTGFKWGFGRIPMLADVVGARPAGPKDEG